jgi:hypothetical protein
MKTKIKLSFVLILLCCLSGWGQKPPDEQKNYNQEITLKKQIAVDELENQAKDIPLTAVRVFLRSKVVEWLWKDGKDETGRAEQLAVKAIDELYEKKNEIPNFYFNSIKSDIFALLETNSKDTAKRLSEKYSLTSEDKLSDAHSLLDNQNGEKLVAEKMLKSLANNSEINPDVALLLDKLQTRKSPEAARILAAILALEESGKSRFSAAALYSIVHNFRDSGVSSDLQKRFFNVVLNKARDAVNSADANVETAHNLLRAVASEIRLKAPDLLAEASGLQLALSAKMSKRANESKEREKRIGESADKLGALISEAEKAEDEGEKYLLYVRAAKLSLERQKFNLAVELAEKAIAGETKAIPKTFREQWYDQFLREVVKAALKKDEIDSARYAIKKMVDKLSKADSLLALAKYYSGKKDTFSAIDAFDEALNLTKKVENGNLKTYTLFRLISAIQKIDKTRIAEVTAETAKVINSIPTLTVDDKPGTKNYENYVNFVMATNYNLLPVIIALAKEDMNEAINFANRIGKKEIKIASDFALSVESLKAESKLADAKVIPR